MRSLLPLFLIASCLAEVGGAATNVAARSAAAVRARVLVLVNAARATPRRCGGEAFPAASALSHSAALSRAARRHALDMAAKHFFEHRGSNGTQPKDRVQQAGYRARITGENIAYAPESAEEVVRGWLASPGHCANIMDSRFSDMGLAYATGRQRGAIYWVQVLASPR